MQQVDKRATGLCVSCPLADACPIADWPDAAPGPAVAPEPLLRADAAPAHTAGPSEPVVTGVPEAVWMTGESLGHEDPARAAHPGLPAVFVFDEPLLGHLRLSAKRLVFLAETLAEIAVHGPVEVHRGDPTQVLAGRPVAVTFAPVPGFARRSLSVRPVVTHPYPWLRRPGPGPVTSFSAWRKRLEG